MKVLLDTNIVLDYLVTTFLLNITHELPKKDKEQRLFEK